MADNIKRPDIQVLEDRIKRIQEQIVEFNGVRMYSSTRKRLSNVRDELGECIVMLDNVISASQTKDEVQQALVAEFTEVIPSEQHEFEDDLSDIFSITVPDSTPTSEKYSSKEIMANYFKRVSECAGVSTGILQINQFCVLLESWMLTRYNRDSKNSSFRYKAQRIHEWIDLIILAAGDALHNKLFAGFKKDFEEWIATINTESDMNWILPKEVMKFQKESMRAATKEAVLIERIVKQTLYDDQFYPSLRDSIEQIVIKSGRFSEEELTTDQIVKDCSGSFFVTGSFDSSKYERRQADV